MLSERAAQESLPATVKKEDYFRLAKAAKHGEYVLLERFLSSNPEESIRHFIREALINYSSEPYQFTMMQFVLTKLPEHLQPIITHDNYWLMHHVMRLYPPFAELFLKQMTQEQVRALYEYDDYYLLHMAGEEHRLDILQMLLRYTPDYAQDLIKAENYLAYQIAVENDDNEMIAWLMETVEPGCIDEMRAHSPLLKLQAVIDAAEEKYAQVEEQISETAFLWRATKEGHAPVYLFNTVHHFPAEMAERFIGLIEASMDKADVCIMESPAFLTRSIFQSYPALTSLDLMVEECAEKMGKPQAFLDDLLMLRLIFQKKPLTDSLSIHEVDERLEALKTNFYSVYLNNVRVPNPDGDGSHVYIRNKLWIEKIVAVSAQQRSSFVAVGARHNQGIFGLPNLLAHEGYTLTPLAKTAPPSTTWLLRQLAEGPPLTFFRHDKPSLPTHHALMPPADGITPGV